jgi:glycyl-tRNA synthetase
LSDAYEEEELEGGDVRTVLKFHPAIAPVKAAILPLSKKLSDKAMEVYAQLSKHFQCEYDDAGSIGKRYRRQDEIGTPFCITIDFDTLEDQTVTLRDRDTMEQIRLSVFDLIDYIDKKLVF